LLDTGRDTKHDRIIEYELAPPRETERVVPFSELTPPNGFAVYVFPIEHDPCRLLLTWDIPYDGGAPIRSYTIAAQSGD
jgi:hypothetical protein